MLDKEQSIFFYNQLNSFIIKSNPISRDDLLKIYSLYRNLLETATEEYNQLFSSNYARLIFLIDRLKIDYDLTSKLKKIHNLFTKIAKDKSLIFNNDEAIFIIYILITLVVRCSRTSIPEWIDDFITKNQNFKYEFGYKTSKHEFVPFVNGIVLLKKFENTNTKSLLLDSFNYGEIQILLNDYWEDILKQVWKNAILNIFNLRRLKESENTYSLTDSSIIVIEPDYLLDVTDISECFHHKGYNPYFYFLKKFIDSEVSSSLLAGNIVNLCLDELIVNPIANFEETFQKALRYKILQLFAFMNTSNDKLKQIEEKTKCHFEVLKNTISRLNVEICSVEPTFLAPKYGLQGRLDLLLEYYDEKNRKDIIELKSGRAPSIDYSIQTHSGQFIRTSIWNNHFAQTTCYNLLLDSAIENRTGVSSILYTSDISQPLRNAPNIIQKKQEVIKLRNIIVSLERAIALGKFSLIDSLNENKFNDIEFAKNNAKEFEKALQNCSLIEKAYFQHFLKFIINETYYGKFLSSNFNGKSGFSSLWKDNIVDKEEGMNILSHLKLIPEESDFSCLHLVFQRKNNNYTSAFRKGDIGILYKIGDNNYSLINSQILKCYIKEITPEKVTISLRNKQINPNLIDANTDWAIEPDYLDVTLQVLYKSLYRFINSNNEKKALILGLMPNKSLNQTQYYSQYLTELQNNIVKKAINSEHYFLIQGPPGTGKTSYVLKALVEYYLTYTDNIILILAYTNRAVDEIADSISKINDDELFLRLGSKEATEKKDNLIAYLAETIPFDNLYRKLNVSRVIIATVSSILMNPEIFTIKKFNLAIIDEASQILEPQLISILTQVQKFIMIGDEKQLPAVVVQPEKNLIVKNNLLNNISLNNLGTSLFERLLNLCIKNNWNDSYGMLVQQARMHRSIQQLVNGLFYSGKLKHFDNDWQKANQIQIYNINNPLIEELTQDRIVFIESEREENLKIHNQEAYRVAVLIDSIMKSYKGVSDNKTIGVITPFRAQCSKIYEEMNPDYRSLVNVDTVERFQGSEREIIIISFAINHVFLLKHIQSLAFSDGIAIDRKLNVALTRSRQQLIMLGVREILIASPIFSDMLKYINVLGKIIHKDNAKKIFK